MSVPRLLAVVEVSKNNRVICSASGCGHSVYKRIHVVRIDTELKVLGSECFKRLFGDSLKEAGPYYGTSDGRRLTDEERLVLIQNTERFIAMLETEKIEAEAIAAQQAEYRRQQADQLAQEHRDRLQRIRANSVSGTEPVSYSSQNNEYKQYEGQAGLHWMWSRMRVEAMQRIFDYNSSEIKTPEKSLIIRYFEANSGSDPWTFANLIQNRHRIPSTVVLRHLHELALIELLPAYATNIIS